MEMGCDFRQYHDHPAEDKFVCGINSKNKDEMEREEVICWKKRCAKLFCFGVGFARICCTWCVFEIHDEENSVPAAPSTTRCGFSQWPTAFGAGAGMREAGLVAGAILV